jgi:hypothetical protein
MKKKKKKSQGPLQKMENKRRNTSGHPVVLFGPQSLRNKFPERCILLPYNHLVPRLWSVKYRSKKQQKNKKKKKQKR